MVITETMLKREAEFLRFGLTGEGGLDEHRWACGYSVIEDWFVLTFKADGSLLEIPGYKMTMKLVDLSEQLIAPFVRALPCVRESAKAKAELARVRADMEYRSWGAPMGVDTASSRA